MNYFIVINNSLSSPGGVEQVVARLLERLPEGILSNVILIQNDARLDNPDLRIKQTVNMKGRKVPFLDKVFMFTQLVYAWRVYRHLLKNVQEGDVVNIHGTEYALFLGLFRRRFMVAFRCIISVHGSYFQQYTDYVVGRLPLKYLAVRGFFYLWRWYAWAIERIAVRCGDYFVFITEDNQRYYQERFGVVASRGTVIYNGCVVKSRTKKLLKRAGSPINALIVGSRVYLKGLDLAIEAVRVVTNAGIPITLKIVGFEDFDTYYPKGRTSLGGCIDYRGMVPHEAMGDVYSESDFLLMPSRFEGFPLTMLEALQYGLPVIASTVCKLNEIDPAGTAGIICNDWAVPTWVSALENVCEITKYNDYAQGVGRIDLTNYDWEHSASSYAKVYQDR